MTKCKNILAIMLLISLLQFPATSSQGSDFRIISITADRTLLRSGAPPTPVTVRIRNIGSAQGTATVRVSSNMYACYRSGDVALSYKKITLNPGEEGSITFEVAYLGGGRDYGWVKFEVKGEEEPIVILYDEQTITFTCVPSVEFLGISEVKIVPDIYYGSPPSKMTVTVSTGMGVPFDLKVKCIAQPPILISPEELEAIVTSTTHDFIFDISLQSNIDTSAIVKIQVYETGELVKESTVIIQGHARREWLSEIWWLLVIVVILLALIMLIAYLVHRHTLKKPFLPSPEPTYPCPTCGNPLTYVPQYRRWYCHYCRKYI